MPKPKVKHAPSKNKKNRKKARWRLPLLTETAKRNMANRHGSLRVSGEAYDPLDDIHYHFVKKLMHLAMRKAISQRARTLKTDHVEMALKICGMSVY